MGTETAGGKGDRTDAVSRVLLAAAGVIATAVLQRLDAPLPLLLGTVPLFLVVALAWKWFLRDRKRQAFLVAVALAYSTLVYWGLSIRPPRYEAHLYLVQHILTPEWADTRLWQATNVDDSPRCEKQVIDAFIGVLLENVQEQPRLVTDLRIEGATLDGRWVPLKRLYYGKTYAVHPNGSYELSLPRLDSMLRDKALPPHEPLRGLLLLQYPRDPNVMGYSTRKFRLTVTDSRGVEEQIELAMRGGAALQDTQTKNETPADLTACRIVGPDTLFMDKPK